MSIENADSAMVLAVLGRSGGRRDKAPKTFTRQRSRVRSQYHPLQESTDKRGFPGVLRGPTGGSKTQPRRALRTRLPRGSPSDVAHTSPVRTVLIDFDPCGALTSNHPQQWFGLACAWVIMTPSWLARGERRSG